MTRLDNLSVDELRGLLAVAALDSLKADAAHQRTLDRRNACDATLDHLRALIAKKTKE